MLEYLLYGTSLLTFVHTLVTTIVMRNHLSEDSKVVVEQLERMSQVGLRV